MALNQTRTPEESVFPSPAEGDSLGINPDGFIWLPVEHAAEYHLEVRKRDANTRIMDCRSTTHYCYPNQAFPAGDYQWRFKAIDANGTLIGTRDWWSFHVPEDIPTTVCPSAKTVLENLTDEHPRLIFCRGDVSDVRERIKTTQSEKLAELKSVVDRAYEMGMPPRPTFHLQETERERRQQYMTYFHEHREYVAQNLRACALMALLFDDDRAGEFAREMLLHVCGFNPEGPNSLEFLWGDEPGLCYARILPEIYDWTYDRYTQKERTYIEKTLVHYAEMIYDRLREVEFTKNPTRSHPARLPGFLGQHVLLLHERLPQAEAMLQHALDIFTTFYPYWGGGNGGWAEGPSYSTAYNSIYIPFFTTFERHTGFSFWDRPFYRQLSDFWLQTVPPNAEDMPYGDGHDTAPANDPSVADRLRFILEYHAAEYDDPLTAARASQFESAGFDSSRLVEEFIHPPISGTSSESPATDAAQSKLFDDVGWAALHTDVMEPSTDTFLLFRSSPYGNVSHSHNNQNAFTIASGGDSLAISTGYRPQHGCPHHEDWTRSTEAHNSILVDGHGQNRGMQATGAITSFEEHDSFVHLCGTAGDAYDDLLDRFHRHILFVRPNLFVIYDDLAATESVPYTWLLHSHEEPDINPAQNTIDIDRGDSHLRTELFASTDLTLSHTDEYSTPVNEGMIDELRMDVPQQHHSSAETESARSMKIVAVMTVSQVDDRPPIQTDSENGAVRIEADQFTGTVEVDEGPISLSGTVNDTESIDIS